MIKLGCPDIMKEVIFYIFIFGYILIFKKYLLIKKEKDYYTISFHLIDNITLKKI
jgi:hypothetical protein